MPRRSDIPPLRRSELREDPIEQFAEWYELAQREEIPLAHAAALATVDARGWPDARMVLMKGFGAEGFRFFTNFESAKATQLDAVQRGALVFYWRELDRQVRVRGSVAKLSDAESDDYFATRPRDSQIGAWASPQSQPLSDRAALDRRAREMEERFDSGDVPRPGFWGGYIMRPDEIEFWQGEVGRLHDRFLYVRGQGGWEIRRLAP